MVLFNVFMRVPLHVARASAGDNANEANAFLDHTAREKATAAVVVRRLLTDAVQVTGGLRFAREVEHCGCLGLHLERQVIGAYASAKLAVIGRERRLV